MRGTALSKTILVLSILFYALLARLESSGAQSVATCSPTPPSSAGQTPDLQSVASLLQQLQAQVQTLNAQVQALRAQQEAAQGESAALRKELEATKSQIVALSTPPSAIAPSQPAPAPGTAQASNDERLSRLEENLQLTEAKVDEQSQTKVESSSKYRIRLTGIVLFNSYINRGSVENQDFPQIATPPSALASSGTFGASLRQSQIGFEAFGPTIAGARTGGEVQFDFAGGFPAAPNGVSFGIMRLRTGTVHFDWEKTSVIAGQDSLFLSPLSPTSIATLAVPALSYAGNLWSWAPQLRVEHRFNLSDKAKLLLQGGILDSLSGETPLSQYYRYPTWGENSGQPAYATRISWSHALAGENLTFGAGGYYGRQNWGFDRTVDSWAGTLDLLLPLSGRFEFSGEFYRGRALGGLGGGIGQSGLWNAPLINPETVVYGLDSMGGWVQLKFKATSKLQFNGAFGQDNPFANDLREHGGAQNYYQYPLSRNQSELANFLYQPRSDIVLSLEYRRLKTSTLDSNANTANVLNFSVGYIF